MATASYIGAGLDYEGVFSVVRDRFPTIIMLLSQDMGRCGRTRPLSDNGV